VASSERSFETFVEDVDDLEYEAYAEARTSGKSERFAAVTHLSSTSWRAGPVTPDFSASVIALTRGTSLWFVEPRMKAWSLSSMLVVSRVAASESVRATTRFSTPMISY
jgi:hypothetical protein